MKTLSNKYPERLAWKWNLKWLIFLPLKSVALHMLLNTKVKSLIESTAKRHCLSASVVNAIQSSTWKGDQGLRRKRLAKSLTSALNEGSQFFSKFLKDISPFCGATDAPVLDFWWCLPWISKPGWISSLAYFSPKCNGFFRFTSDSP